MFLSIGSTSLFLLINKTSILLMVFSKRKCQKMFPFRHGLIPCDITTSSVSRNIHLSCKCIKASETIILELG